MRMPHYNANTILQRILTPGELNWVQHWVSRIGLLPVLLFTWALVRTERKPETKRILHGRAEIRKFSSSVEIYFTSARNERREICISKRPCNVLFIISWNTDEIPNHFTLIFFWCERRDLLCSHSNSDIFTCEDNMLFSHVKILSFRAKAHLVFH